MRKLLFLITVIITGNLLGADQNEKLKELESRIEKLEKIVASLSSGQPVVKQNNTSEKTASSIDINKIRNIPKSSRSNISSQRMKARQRMRADWKVYSRKQLQKIERLYQSRGHRNGSEEKRRDLKTVISNYSKANRAGCAMLYLGQFNSNPKKQEFYIKQAINKHGDCFYGDGVQIGAYGKFYLAKIYLSQGRKEEAEKLFREVLKKYPGAINHRQQDLSKIINSYLTSIK